MAEYNSVNHDHVANTPYSQMNWRTDVGELECKELETINIALKHLALGQNYVAHHDIQWINSGENQLHNGVQISCPGQMTELSHSFSKLVTKLKKECSRDLSN